MEIRKDILRYAAPLMVIFLMSFIVAGVFAADEAGQPEQVIKVTAKKFEYSPNEIMIKKGVPVVLEFTSLDRVHGFNCYDLGIRATIEPGKVTRVRITAPKAGAYPFLCDIFCGDGHEGMTGKIIVEE